MFLIWDPTLHSTYGCDWIKISIFSFLRVYVVLLVPLCLCKFNSFQDCSSFLLDISSTFSDYISGAYPKLLDAYACSVLTDSSTLGKNPSEWYYYYELLPFFEQCPKHSAEGFSLYSCLTLLKTLGPWLWSSGCPAVSLLYCENTFLGLDNQTVKFLQFKITSFFLIGSWSQLIQYTIKNGANTKHPTWILKLPSSQNNALKDHSVSLIIKWERTLPKHETPRLRIWLLKNPIILSLLFIKWLTLGLCQTPGFGAPSPTHTYPVYLWSVFIVVSEVSTGLFPKWRNEKTWQDLEVSPEETVWAGDLHPGFLIN